MNLKTTKNEATGVISITIDDRKFGHFAVLDDDWCYFPANTHDLTGDHYILIGKALNEINETKDKS